jgi:hypothetical protein
MTARTIVPTAMTESAMLVTFWTDELIRTDRGQQTPNDQELSHAAGDSRQPKTRSKNCQA